VSLLAYPSLHQTREQVIEFMYCTLGNGYEWRDGRLQERCNDEKMKVVTEMLLESKSEAYIRAWVKAKDEERQSRSFADVKKRLKEIGVDFDPPSLSAPKSLKIYPLCNLCHILTLPDRIRRDWLEGAEEVVGLIRVYDSYDAAATSKNRKFIQAIRKRIQELKERGRGKDALAV